MLTATSFVAIYGGTTYGRHTYSPTRAEEGEHRDAHHGARGGQAAPRLRDRQAHRRALRRRAPVPRRLALPAALPAGEARHHQGAVGREGRPAPPPLLPPDGGGEAGAGRPAQ